MSSPVFEAARERLLERFGEAVAPWWGRLPETLDHLASRWDVLVGEPVGRGNTSLVIRCQHGDGRAAVLKITPEVDLAHAEATALRSWAPSHKVPKVRAHAPELGALLLEAIPNEMPIAELGTAVDLDDVAGLIRALHDSGDPVVGDGVVSLADRVEFMFEHWTRTHGDSSPVPAKRVRRGYELAIELLENQRSQVLLHGDLHPYNVLDGGEQRGLVAIDPRPCVGDAAFDAVDWVIWPKDDPQNWTPRCNRLGEALDLDADRIWDWLRIFAAMLAATTLARGDMSDRAGAFLAIAP
jgi:streptomycin 6-kinase